MKKILTSLIAVISLTSTGAFADSLKPMQALSFDLGDRLAVVYYTENDGVFEVVTTIGPNENDGGKIVRHVAKLSPGEDYTLAVAGSGSQGPAHRIQIERSGNEIDVAMQVNHNLVAAVY